eukprot:627142-Rhodomonas_salina.2
MKKSLSVVAWQVTTVLSISKCCEDECALASRNETMCVNTAPNEEECDASFYGLCSCIWEPANSTCYAVLSGLEEQQDTVVGLDKKRDLEAKRIDVSLPRQSQWLLYAAKYESVVVLPLFSLAGFTSR